MVGGWQWYPRSPNARDLGHPGFKLAKEVGNARLGDAEGFGGLGPALAFGVALKLDHEQRTQLEIFGDCRAVLDGVPYVMKPGPTLKESRARSLGCRFGHPREES